MTSTHGKVRWGLHVSPHTPHLELGKSLQLVPRPETSAFSSLGKVQRRKEEARTHDLESKEFILRFPCIPDNSETNSGFRHGEHLAP